MDKFNTQRGGWILPTFIILTAIFLIAEGYFIILVRKYGNNDIMGSSIKTFYLILLIILYIFDFKWAKWVLLFSLLLYSIACLISGIENETQEFFLISFFYIAYAIILFLLAKKGITLKRKLK